jgi:hypothetical protein
MLLEHRIPRALITVASPAATTEIADFRFQISDLQFSICNLQFAICNRLAPQLPGPFRVYARAGFAPGRQLSERR